ncbi:hypothetical protein MMC22_008063 [Lobaria immixta]|nr:hypothetical protein [Lobaria immixta]
MDQLRTRSAPYDYFFRSQDFLRRVPTHSPSAGHNQVDSNFLSIPNHDVPVATSSSSMGLDSSLLLKIDKVEFFIRRLRHYWAAVADDIGLIIWAHPTNVYRQIWEKEISAAYSELQHLIEQMHKPEGKTNPNPDKDPFSFRQRGIRKTSNQKINPPHRPHRLQEEGLEDRISALASREAEARSKRTLRRKLTRKRAKARRSTTEANPCVDQSFSNLPHPLNTNWRLVAKKRIETVQNQILALDQKLTIASGPNKSHCDRKSEGRLLKFEEHDGKENRLSPWPAGFDTATSWGSNETLSKVEGGKYNERQRSYIKKDINAYSGILARTFRPSSAADIDKYSIAREEDAYKVGSHQSDEFALQGRGVSDPQW